MHTTKLYGDGDDGHDKDDVMMIIMVMMVMRMILLTIVSWETISLDQSAPPHPQTLPRLRLNFFLSMIDMYFI